MAHSFQRHPNGTKAIGDKLPNSATCQELKLATEQAAKRGLTNVAPFSDRRPAEGLCGPRQRAALKAERASLAAQGRRVETEAVSIRYVAEVIGADTDSERAIRWMTALMVLCCDPFSI
jgi:hypothetical protein